MKVLIPLAGRGKRFLDAGYKVPKPLIVVDGCPIIEHIVRNFSKDDDFIFAINEEQEKDTNIVSVLKSIAPKCRIITIAYKKEGPLYGLRSMESCIDDNEEIIVNYCDFSWLWDYKDFKKKIVESNCDGAIVCYRGFHPHLLGPNNYATLDASDLWMKEIREKHSWHKNKMDDWSSSGTYYFKKGKYLKKYLHGIEKRPEWKINDEFYVSQLFQLMKEDNLNIFIYEIPFMLQWGTPEDLEEYLYWSDYFRQKIGSLRHGMKHEMDVIVPMAGEGKRFQHEGYTLPKPLIKIDEFPMFIQAARAIPEGNKYIFVVRKELAERKDIKESISGEFKSAQIIEVDYLTEGQACTVLLAEKAIDPDKPLMIGACDNGMVYDFKKFDEMISPGSGVDAMIFTFRNNPTVKRNPKMYGWVLVRGDSRVLKVSVKIPISDNPVRDHAVVGSFWFRKGRYFIDNVKEMIKANDRINNEFYIDNCMNYLVKNNLNVHVFELEKYICWGTPNDLKTYEYWNRYFSLKSLNKISLSIVVPCFNEVKNLNTLLTRFDQVIDRNNMELVVVDNGSKDNTWNFLQEAKKRYSYLKPVKIDVNIGYGNGIVQGLKNSTGEILAWTHADMQCDPEDVIRAYQLYIKESKTRPDTFVKGYRTNRKTGEKFFSFAMQLLASLCLGTYLSEINAQPKLFSKIFFDSMKNPPDDFSLDLYALYLAKKKGCNFVTMPVDFKNRLYGEAKGGGGSDFKTKWKLIKRTFKYIFELKDKIAKEGVNLNGK